jgi:XTP/dITP diphosphohydrolase
MSKRSRGEEDMRPQIKIVFATSNKNKVYEAKQVLSKFGIKVEKTNIEKVELQSEKLEKIVSYALMQIKEENRIVVIEDSGLFINILNGFPGPYSSFVFKKIGCDGILKLMEDERVRKAEFVSVVGCKHKGRKVLFKEKTYGTISTIKAGKSGFGFDPIFIPEGYLETFAQMSLSKKNQLSH